MCCCRTYRCPCEQKLQSPTIRRRSPDQPAISTSWPLSSYTADTLHKHHKTASWHQRLANMRSQCQKSCFVSQLLDVIVSGSPDGLLFTGGMWNITWDSNPMLGKEDKMSGKPIGGCLLLIYVALWSGELSTSSHWDILMGSLQD